MIGTDCLGVIGQIPGYLYLENGVGETKRYLWDEEQQAWVVSAEDTEVFPVLDLKVGGVSISG